MIVKAVFSSFGEYTMVSYLETDGLPNKNKNVYDMDEIKLFCGNKFLTEQPNKYDEVIFVSQTGIYNLHEPIPSQIGWYGGMEFCEKVNERRF